MLEGAGTLRIGIGRHNRAGGLAESLAALARYRAPQGCSPETLVVANACADGPADVCRAAGVGMAAGPRPGLGHARNAAIATASGEANSLEAAARSTRDEYLKSVADA